MNKVVVVGSSINPRSGRFTYSETRSKFNAEERFRQTIFTVNSSEFIPSVNKTINFEADYNYMFDKEIDSIYIIDSAFGLPTGFTIRERNIVGYVNFTTSKTIVVKLSDNTYYNVIIKPPI